MRKNVAMAVLLASSTLLAQMPVANAGGEVKRTPYYVDPLLLDLSTILPVPPTQDSEMTKQELAYVHTVEQTRTPQQVAQAQQDDKEEDLFLFANVIGPQFTKADLPLTAELSSHVHNDEAVLSDPLKFIYKRPRPYQYDSTLHPVCKTDHEPSYPSGHSMSGYLLAFTMAQLVPEKREEILMRADEYAHDRVVCGVHYPSDTEASRKLAYTIFGYMMGNPRFQRDLAAARVETRRHLGLAL